MCTSVTCNECGMVLEVETVWNQTLTGKSSTEYHILDLNEHMQLHEGD